MANLVSVKYVGNLPAVEVDFDGFGEQTVVFEETVKVEERVARTLLEQPRNWQLAPVATSLSNPKKTAEEAN